MSALQNAALAQEGEHLVGALVQRIGPGLDDDLGLVGRLIRRGDAGKGLDLPCPRLLVQTLHVTLLAHFERGLAVDLDEVAMHDQAAHALAVGTERRDERGHGDHASLYEQLGDFADAADVLHAVLIGETKVTAQAVADVVAVEHEGAALQSVELFFHRMRQRGFSRTGQPCEPQDRALVPVHGFALLTVDGGLVPDDVGTLITAHDELLNNRIED